MLIATIFTIPKTWNQPKCPSNDKLDKENVVHIHHGILCSHKNEFMSFAGTWMKLETIILSKLTGTENQTPHVLTHKWELNSENTWTQEGEHHTLGPIDGCDLGEGDGGSEPPWHVYTYVTILHDLHLYPRTSSII